MKTPNCPSHRRPIGARRAAALPRILAAIKDGQPDTAASLLAQLRTAGSCSNVDIAILAHRIAASYRAEGRDAEAYQTAISAFDPAVPQLLWDAGFAAYRLGDWADAASRLEQLAQNNAAQNSTRAQGAFWAARAHMQSGDPVKVVTLLEFAAKQNPSFYGILAEHALGIDTKTGLSDPLLTQADFSDLMRVPAARRAVALSQIGENEFVGSELNRAFVNNNPQRLDPGDGGAGAQPGRAQCRAARQREKRCARGMHALTGLVPGAALQRRTTSYRIDSSPGAGLRAHRKSLPDPGDLACRGARADAADAGNRNPSGGAGA